MVVAGPFDELNLPHQQRFQPPAFRHLCDRQSLAPPPSFLLREVRERHSLISSGLILSNNSIREAGVNPLLVRTACGGPHACAAEFANGIPLDA
jgi:hypothetical protein